MTESASFYSRVGLGRKPRISSHLRLLATNSGEKVRLAGRASLILQRAIRGRAWLDGLLLGPEDCPTLQCAALPVSKELVLAAASGSKGR